MIGVIALCAGCASSEKIEGPEVYRLVFQPIIAGAKITAFSNDLNTLFISTFVSGSREWNAGNRSSLGINTGIELDALFDAGVAAANAGVLYYPFTKVEDSGLKPFLLAGGLLGIMDYDETAILGGAPPNHIPATQRSGVEIGAGFLTGTRTGFYFRTMYRVFGFTLHPDASDGWTGTRHVNLSGLYIEWGFGITF